MRSSRLSCFKFRFLYRPPGIYSIINMDFNSRSLSYSGFVARVECFIPLRLRDLDSLSSGSFIMSFIASTFAMIFVRSFETISACSRRVSSSSLKLSIFNSPCYSAKACGSKTGFQSGWPSYSISSKVYNSISRSGGISHRGFSLGAKRYNEIIRDQY